MSKNITLAIDEAVLAQVRRIAAEQNTSVNAMVRDYLTQLATREDRVKEAMRNLETLSENSALEVGSGTWSRDELHER